jgi:hypothetical protein
MHTNLTFQSLVAKMLQFHVTITLRENHNTQNQTMVAAAPKNKTVGLNNRNQQSD